MAKARLLPAVCTISLLAAVPAFAQQTITQPATTGADNSVNAPVADNTASPRADDHAAHRTVMASHSSGGTRARNSGSQDAAVDQLNEQSYQAAQRGQTLGASGTMAPAGSDSMSGGSASSVPAASGAGGGTGAN